MNRPAKRIPVHLNTAEEILSINLRFKPSAEALALASNISSRAILDVRLKPDYDQAVFQLLIPLKGRASGMAFVGFPKTTYLSILSKVLGEMSLGGADNFRFVVERAKKEKVDFWTAQQLLIMEDLSILVSLTCTAARDPKKLCFKLTIGPHSETVTMSKAQFDESAM
ncbi:MAG TPA: hypothetical protein VFQ72_03340 [Candidatus Paceibacterota bacterium]|nr:hypothetical protein [Candidatus Paceibacterota bacterium]